MADYSKEIKDILVKSGCYFVRQGKGDHEIWYIPIPNKKFPVDSTIKSRHTATKILKQAGISKHF